MRVEVLPSGTPARGRKSTVYLVEDNWNDWFKYQTMYFVQFRDANGNLRDIGSVKVGQFDWQDEQNRPDLPEQSSGFGDNFFSLGQDVTYYETLGKLHLSEKLEILEALRDVVDDEERFERALELPVMYRSLLRSVDLPTVKEQFARVLAGGTVLTNYRFSYAAPLPGKGSDLDPLIMDYKVEARSNPPTNIHVLIGRNGVGKTHLLTNMSRALADQNADPSEVGYFLDSTSQQPQIFTNLVSVSFSAFDTVEPIDTSIDRRPRRMRYSYVGLKRAGKTSQSLTVKTPAALASEFGKSVVECIASKRIEKWHRALEVLEADPIFAEANVADLADSASSIDVIREEARDLFRRMSSGHKIVLLIITRLVEKVDEKSLVLLDEPEAHLHPPLLSAFIRALSNLLIDRNGVAIIASHSPVVLQEVPRRCVWKLRRVGWQWAVDRPEIETFGENVGVLTQEVFGLEVASSGFHKLLFDAVQEGLSFGQVRERFGNELGGEAEAIARSLIAVRDSSGTR